jgi:hypothetical protein
VRHFILHVRRAAGGIAPPLNCGVRPQEMNRRFDTDGYLISGPLLSAEECDECARLAIDRSSVEVRNMLSFAWCRALARRIASIGLGFELIPRDAVAFQCTFFEKSPERNWLVPLHQDLSIPVAEIVAAAELMGWSVKAGVVYAQPPVALLNQLVAVRLQLDAPSPNDGPLRVVVGTHRYGRLNERDAGALRDRIGETTCAVPKGGLLFMRPLLLHASSKLKGAVGRRVLHFVFGPRELPFGLRWANAA